MSEETKTNPENPKTDPDPKTTGEPADKGNDAEAARIRLKMKEQDKVIADLKAKTEAYEKEKEEAKKAELSEMERLKADKEAAESRAKESETKLSAYQKESAFKIAALQAGCVDPEAAVKIADLSNFNESDADAVKVSIEDFKKARPYLFDGKAAMAQVGVKGAGDPNPNVSKADEEKKQKLEEAEKKGDSLAALQAITQTKQKAS